MSYTRYETVAFGGSKAGLSTVGYRLYDETGAAIGGRATDGVQDLGGGQYGADVTFPTGFRGRITWDTGEAAPAVASAEINPPEDSPQDPLDDARLDALEEQVSAIDRALQGEFSGPGILGDDVVRAGIPEKDDCKVLTRLKAFIVPQGSVPVLEHVFRDRKGRPMDLSGWLAEMAVSDSSGSSASAATPTGRVRVRVTEFSGGLRAGSARSPIWELDETASYRPADGVLRCRLEATLTEHPGIYEMTWAVCDAAGNPVHVDRALLSVERSLFPANLDTAYANLGPPTFQEIRMRLMDSAASENNLLDDVEFNDDQIALALVEPVRLWNETPPPIRLFTTRDFPFRGAWVSGVMAQLHLMAANHYRRNRLAHSAGGTTVDDKNKFKEYSEEGQRLWQEYRDWLFAKKIEVNARLMVGSSVSAYSTRNGW